MEGKTILQAALTRPRYSMKFNSCFL